MELQKSNAPHYNLRQTTYPSDDLPKHERPLRIKLGGTSIDTATLPRPADHKETAVTKPESQNAVPIDITDDKPTPHSNNVYINVNIFFSKSLPSGMPAQPNPVQKAQHINGVDLCQQTPLVRAEAHRNVQDVSKPQLQLIGLPSEHVISSKMLSVPNKITSLFENSRSSDADNYAELRKRETTEIKCACHHLHVNDNVKISRFSYKSQLRKIRNKWNKAATDFPIIFKRKVARIEDEDDSLSINEIVDFSKKLIQPDCENDFFGISAQF